MTAWENVAMPALLVVRRRRNTAARPTLGSDRTLRGVLGARQNQMVGAMSRPATTAMMLRLGAARHANLSVASSPNNPVLVMVQHRRNLNRVKAARTRAVPARVRQARNLRRAVLRSVDDDRGAVGDKETVAKAARVVPSRSHKISASSRRFSRIWMVRSNWMPPRLSSARAAAERGARSGAIR